MGTAILTKHAVVGFRNGVSFIATKTTKSYYGYKFKTTPWYKIFTKIKYAYRYLSV